MWERTRAACVRAALLAAVAAAIALVVWVAVSISRERQDPRAVARPAQAAALEETGGTSAGPAQSRPERVTTAFVRRLEVGADLRRLFDDVEEKGVGAAMFADRYDALRPYLLHADGKPKGEERPSRTLLRLTEPRRDLASLVVARGSAEDPLGPSMRVRIWTRETAHPEEGRARVEATFDHIVRSVGREMKEGVDVLITPGMGRDVFPYQPGAWFAIGVYLPKDRYCAVRSRLPPDFLTEVAEHEVIHAYHLSMKSSTESRFVSEGLAEYLRLIEPSDVGLEVPTERLADSCAELQCILLRMKDAGIHVDKVDPRRLVELSPRDFYSLQHLGYLVAQVAMAYVGGATVQHALKGDTDAALVEAVRRIVWADFLRFVGEGARGGTVGRVQIVEDAPWDGDWYPRERGAFRKALEAAGAKLPDDRVVDSSIARVATIPFLATRLEEFMDVLGDGEWTPRICIDLSEAMDRPLRLAPVPQPLAGLFRSPPRSETPRGFAKELVKLLAAQRRVEVVGLAKERRVGGVAVLDAVEPLRLLAAADGATPAVDILVIGSAGTAREAASVSSSLGSVLLVVDLTPDGEALEIARAADERRLVAYWRPIE